MIASQHLALAALAVSALFSAEAAAQSHGAATPPSFSASGALEPGSGQGRADSTIYYAGMRFPLEVGPAFANSQVYRPGGSRGGPGGQCAAQNYQYPWRDTFCETRQWSMQLCPASRGHQGQDIRPSTCRANTWWAVAAEGGVIASIGTYSVTLQTPRGTLYRYLHLQMDDLAVREFDEVKRGQRLGKVSNNFGKTPTTIHLHFDIKDTIAVNGDPVAVFMPPYASLVSSYKKLLSSGEVGRQ